MRDKRKLLTLDDISSRLRGARRAFDANRRSFVGRLVETAMIARTRFATARRDGARDDDDDGRERTTLTRVRFETTGKYVSVAWPETGVWYDAKVMEIDAKARTATLWYPDSLGPDAEEGERESINLEEAILDDEVSWPVYRDEAHAREMMARRDAQEARGAKRERTKQPNRKRMAEMEAAKAEEEKIRSTVREFILKAMEMAAEETKASGHDEANGTPSEVAAAVESALYKKCGSADKEYRTRARSLKSNLQDVRNPQLRARVLANDW